MLFIMSLRTLQVWLVPELSVLGITTDGYSHRHCNYRSHRGLLHEEAPDVRWSTYNVAGIGHRCRQHPLRHAVTQVELRSQSVGDSVGIDG